MNVGLIPACAGKTDHQVASKAATGAHPRVCGENPVRVGETPSLSGSSPRVRGKPTALSFIFHNAGLIPACAGKTSL